MNRQTEIPTDGRPDRQTDRQKNRQPDEQTDRQTGRRTDRQKEKKALLIQSAFRPRLPSQYFKRLLI